MLFSLLFGCFQLSSCSASKEKFSSYSFDYFDTVTTITGYADSKEEFDSVSDAIMSELEEYHKLFTIYNRYEDLNNLCSINTLHGDEHLPIKVDKKIIDMLLFSKDMYQKTNGKVNVAMGSVLSIWHEYRQNGINSPDTAKLPLTEELAEAAKHTDIEKIIIDEKNSTVFLSDPKMLLDVGAIAKGYAVEKIAQSLIAKGITGYVINVGGNVRSIGARGDNSDWSAGIDNPYGSENDPYYAILELKNLSLVTSGSYQRYYIVDGKEYNHIIDPSTLMPSDKYTSVSIVCESSAIADALSTALFCTDLEEGLDILNRFENVEAMWADKNGVIQQTKGFSKYIQGD